MSNDVTAQPPAVIDPPHDATEPLSALSLRGVTKTFPGVVALDSVDLDVRPGEVHALVGENGAGKSTLMGVACGSLVPDSGIASVCGHVLAGGAQEATAAGLAIVRQQPALLPDLTLAENMVLGDHPGVPISEATEWTSAALNAWDEHSGIDPRARANTLPAETRFVAEIAKALALKPAVLVLDEPTEHLRKANVERLFEVIREMTREGTAVVYISHRIHEVLAVADRVTVLRDGRSQGTFERSDLQPSDVVALIAGRPLEFIFPDKARTFGEVGFAVKAFSAAGFEPLDLEIRRGEIIGLAGIEGNGQRDFVRALAGLETSRGDVEVGGRRVRVTSPRRALSAGIAFIPEDRPHEGVIPDYTIRTNITLRSTRQYTKAGLRMASVQERLAQDASKRFAIKAPDLDTRVGALSGGNQQKVVLSDVLNSQPRVVLADEPTQGVDVGTRAEIYRHLRETAEAGTAVVILSSDALELSGLCDRVLVFSRGVVVGELTGEDLTEPQIARAIVTSTAERKVQESSGRSRVLDVLAGHWAPLALIALASVVLGAYTASVNDRYLSAVSMTSLLSLTATLALVAMAQQVVMLVGGIDLSVGPLMALMVVLESFYLVDNATVANQASGWLLFLVVPLLVGTVNWALVDLVGLSAIIATLAMYMALQAVALILRPVPDGFFSDPILEAIGLSWSGVPLMFVVAACLAVGLEVFLLRSRPGARLRAVGSERALARTLGLRDLRYRWGAYAGCSLLAGLAGIPLMAQVGSGNPTAGNSYMLTSIAAVAVGGASLFGGRGSFIGAFLGALLLLQVNSVTAFIGLDVAWNWFILGAVLVLAVALYSKSREMVMRR